MVHRLLTDIRSLLQSCASAAKLRTSGQSHAVLRIAKMRETCRAREVNSQAGPGDEDAVDEETLCRHGFAFEAEHRRLYMLCCYYDEAAVLFSAG